MVSATICHKQTLKYLISPHVAYSNFKGKKPTHQLKKYIKNPIILTITSQNWWYYNAGSCNFLNTLPSIINNILKIYIKMDTNITNKGTGERKIFGW